MSLSLVPSRLLRPARLLEAQVHSAHGTVMSSSVTRRPVLKTAAESAPPWSSPLDLLMGLYTNTYPHAVRFIEERNTSAPILGDEARQSS